MSAIISADQRYRYQLWRDLDDPFDPMVEYRPFLNFIMLNPSTADATQDDATIRVLRTLTAQWGYRRFAVTNLFAYRSTDPWHMMNLRHPLAVGPENDLHLIETAATADHLVAAWGTWGCHQHRDKEVANLLARDLCCIALTHYGMPHHPLRVKLPPAPLPYALPVR